MKNQDANPPDPYELTIEVLDPGGASPASSSSASSSSSLGPSDTMAVGRSAVPLFSDRRRGLGAVVGGIVLIGLVALLGGILSPPPSQSQTETVTNPLPSTESDLQLAGFGGTIGGSLAGDPPVLSAIRRRTMTLGQENDLSITSSPQDVLVLWAGDVNDARHAVVMFRQQDIGWTVAVLSGAGSSPTAQRSGPAPSSSSLPSPTGSRSPPPAGSSPADVSTTWRPLSRQGAMVWVGALNPAEEYLASYRTARHAGPDEDPATGYGPDSLLAATVLSSPDGDYLWGLCEAHLFPQKDGSIGVNTRAAAWSATRSAVPARPLLYRLLTCCTAYCSL